MRVKVTKRGLIIPKAMLADAEEVEIRREDHRIVISPVMAPDPVLGLGQHPVECGAGDGSERHDEHLYGRGNEEAVS